MTTLYKATRPDGKDFCTGTINYAAALESGEVVRHPRPAKLIGWESGATAAGYLSVSTVPTDCIGARWPCRLFEVEAVGRACLDDRHASKRRVKALRVVRELPAADTLGPQGVHVAALLEQCGRLTGSEFSSAKAAWTTAWAGAWTASQAEAWTADGTARGAAWDVVWNVAWSLCDAAEGAAFALLVRDLISTEHYDTLTMPWRQTIGRIHPDDPEVAR